MKLKQKILGMFDFKVVTLTVYIYLRSLSLNKTVEISRAFYEEHVLSKGTILKFIEYVADELPNHKVVTQTFKPIRSGYYALDGTWFKYRGYDLVLLICFDTKTLDVINYSICREETYEAYKNLIKQCLSEIKNAKGFYFDGDPGLIKVLNEFFPDVPKQLCVFHKFRRCSQIIPFKRISKQNEPLKNFVNKILYADSEAEARLSLEKFTKYVNVHDKRQKAKKLLGALKRNFDYLLTHFEHPEMAKDNNVLEGFNAIINTRINLMKGFKKPINIHRYLKVIISDYRLHAIKESSLKERNGKCPLELAGCEIPKFFNTIDFLIEKFSSKV